MTGRLEDVDHSRLGTFDKVFAVNVNLFWIRPAQAELHRIAGLLRPNGGLHLVYEPPSAGSLAHLRDVLLSHLDQAGYRSNTTSRNTQHSPLLAVKALPLRVISRSA